MEEIKHKSPATSRMETRYIVMPQHANDYGILFGGTLVAWIDMLAAMVAQKHCECEAVTVSIDRISFHEPILVGHHVVLRAAVNFVGSSSMEIGVQVMRENPYTGESVRATTAYLTFVGIDRAKKPTPIPKITPQTPDEIRRYENAKIRVESRKDLLRKLSARKT
jgi:acyl-CoA hydrolase